MISELLSMNKSNVKNRNLYDVINDILFCCSERWLSRTNIYSYISLMHSKRYLINFLVDKELLNIKLNPSYTGRMVYKTSGKGLRFCKLYFEMVKLI